MTREGNDTYGLVKWWLMVDEDPHISTAPSSNFTVDYQEEMSQSDFDWKKSPKVVHINRLETWQASIFPGIERMYTNQDYIKDRLNGSIQVLDSA